MKKLLILIALTFVSVALFAQEEERRPTFEVYGEARTGVFQYRTDDRRGLPESTQRGAAFGNPVHPYYPFSGDGRFRLNMRYANARGNLGFNVRLTWQPLSALEGPVWNWAYGWGRFFDDQLTLSVGRLGTSPWGTGGPEMWRSLEIVQQPGFRFEWTPNFLPAGHSLNVGFVINYTDEVADAGGDRDSTLLDILQESVIGAAYQNDWFLVRAAYRFDSVLDSPSARAGMDADIQEGTQFVYRVEEFVLRNFVPYFRVWALGSFWGIGSDIVEFERSYNWLFLEYAPPLFTAQLRLGIDVTEARRQASIRPWFILNLFDGMLQPSILFTYANDFGDHQVVPGSNWSYIAVQPEVRFNFTSNAHIAAAFYWSLTNELPFPNPPEVQRRTFNLRVGINF